ncbi:stromal cell derived factor 4 [Phyllostomus discolor]|uniref:45 kDa calcium-binding protein n=1 Tax=Phyllostomus discolor TaxID=89673 RepID=A0A834AK71_9CHIR|nr:stromal cell derived factor 4 [Phyllostomus discolor]
MPSTQAPGCSLAPRSLWLLGAVLLVGASARPANHSSTRDRAGRREDSEILPPDHLNGVKLEMDGHLNKDFHQEVFLGKDTDGFEEDAEPRRSRRKLMVIFSKVDVNADRRISAQEMQRWIVEKTAEHFQEAVGESRAHFRAVDPDGDGRVSWDEYKVKFLASKGHNEREVAEKIRNDQELKVDEETQEVLENLKDRWYQADNPPPDLLLTEKEFEELIDANHDGVVTMEELEEYMDPMNEYNALTEAKQMIAVADENQNRHLEPEEVLKYSEFFTGSKLMDYARNVHEEF